MLLKFWGGGRAPGAPPSGELTRAPLYVCAPAKRGTQPDLFPNLAVLVTLAGFVPQTSPDPSVYRRPAPQIDSFPNLAIGTAPPALLQTYADPPQSRRAPIAPEIYPNLAVGSAPAYTPPPALQEPVSARRFAQVEAYPNLAALAPIPLVQLNEPIEPWTNKRYPPQLEIFQNQAIYAPVAPQTFPTPTDVTDTRAWHWSYIAYAPDILPNIAIGFTNLPAIVPKVIETPAGRHRRHRRLYVEIDGNTFEVNSVQEAVELLERAKRLALANAPVIAEQKLAVHLTMRPMERPKIEKPRITSSNPELQVTVKEARMIIGKVYADAYRDAEIKLRLARIGEDDDDDVLMLI